MKGLELICPDKCTCEEMKIECYEVIPKFIPGTVTEVFIYNPPSGEKFDFTGNRWKNVTRMSINPGLSMTRDVPAVLRILHEDEFAEISNLEYLQITCRCLKDIRKDAFRGLNKLLILDLSNNVDLSMKQIVLGLSGNNILPNLIELYLSNVSAGQSENSNFVIRTDFYEVIRTKPLKILDFSDSQRIWFDTSPAIQGAFPYLEKLNLSKAGFAGATFTRLLWDMWSLNYSTFERLKIIDVSYPLAPVEEAILLFDSRMFTDIHVFFPPNLQEVYAKRFFFTTANSESGTANDTMLCIFQDYKDKMLKRCVNGNFGQLTKFVLTDNSIVHIDAAFIQVFANLLHLDLSQNRLGEAIAVKKYASSIMEHLQHLQVLIISHNGIYHIPEESFKSCKSLQKLDLSHNELKTITFSTEYLVLLQELDVSYNEIMYLDSANILKLDQLLASDTGRERAVKVSLEGNPFRCECESVTFLKWLLDLNSTHFCDLSSETVEIDFATLQKSEYMCKENTVIAVFSGFAVVVAVVTAAAVYSIVRQQGKVKKQERRTNVIEMFQMKAREQYKRTPPVFLSFCSHDDDIIAEYIIPKLNTGMQAVLGTNLRTVATGVTDMRLGLPIGHEIIRCIETSSVVIFFLTKAFCKSSWCRYEAQVAHLEKKPIVLMFWEEIDTKLLPVEFRKFLSQMTCVYWDYRNGRCVMRPRWTELCDTIVGLMGEAETAL